MKNPINILLHEHKIIASAIDIAMQADKLIGNNNELYNNVVTKLLDFFQNYADKIHHRKENLVLFPEMIKKSELLREGLIHEMYDNHDEFQGMINKIEQLLLKNDYLRVQQQLHVYAEALLNHIAVENDEVFQIAESLFNDLELENMYFRFIDTDTEMLLSTKSDLEKRIEELRKLI